jgi:hypothetical protein
MKRTSMLRAGLAVTACAGLAAPSVLAAGPKNEWPPVTRPIADRAAAQVRQPAALHSTPLGLMADGLRWQAIARAYELSERSANTPTPQGLKADGLRWQALAEAYRQSVAPNVRNAPAVAGTPQVRADVIRAQALNKLYGNAWTHVTPTEFRRLVTAFGPEVTTTMSPQQARAEFARGQGLNQLAKRYATATPPAPVASGNGFDWPDAGIGVAVAFGAMLLAAAGAIALRKRSRLVLHS